jgi:energy-coupling factor transporter ATP-binding protein EcfA2
MSSKDPAKKSARPPDRQHRRQQIDMDSVERLAHAINVYRDSCGTLWVDGPVNRALKLESAECRDYVTEKLLKELGCKPTKQVIDVLISKLRNTARAGPTVEVPIRVAAIRAGSGFDLASGDKIILDLADLQGRVVEISLQGAQLTTYRRVSFFRPPGLLPLPEPHLGDNVNVRQALAPILPFPGDDPRAVVVAVWLLAALFPVIPQPILMIVGEQGSGKSVLAKVLREMIDPNGSPVRRPPDSERDLFIAGASSYVLVFDNLTGIGKHLADALCAISTGGSYSTRKLYTNDEEVVFTIRRPVIITSIDPVTVRPDFLDRTLLLELSALPDKRPSLELEETHQRCKPRILGALLLSLQDALVARCFRRAEKLADPHRLVDMHELALMAAESEHFGWTPEVVDAAIRSNRDQVRQLAVDASPIISLVTELAREGFEGTATQLLTKLEALAPKIQARRGDLPRSPEELGRALAREEPILRSRGVIVGKERGPAPTRQRLIQLSLGSAAPVAAARRPVSLNPAHFAKRQ